MKKLSIFAFALLLSITAISQAPVPFYWAFPNTTLPAGFTMGVTPGGATYLPSFYASNGNTAAPSFKLSGTNHYLTINIAAEAGEISYFLKGQNVTGAPFQGTIDLEFSDNGTTWTSARTDTNSDISTSAYTQYKDTCLPSTRYIRFFYTLKVSGVNLSLDDILIGSPLASPEAEINAIIGADTVFSGSKHYTSETVGNTKRINIIIENQGTDSTLNLTSVVSSNPTEFNVVSFPSSIVKLANDTIKLDFTPSAGGARLSTLTIANNDSTENPYIIDFIGYGNGLATEPSTPASVSFSDIKTYKYKTAYTGTSPLSDESYLVLFKNGSAPTGVPTDGVEYSAGESIGNAKIAYVGKNLDYLSKETYANSTYHIAVYSYSGFGTYCNYNSTPRTGSFTTPATMQAASHYSTLSSAATTFVTDLSTLTNTHTLRFYSDFDDTYINEFAVRDTTNGNKVVTCVYSGDEYIYSPPFNFSYISREHSYPQSWMATYGDNTLPEYSDYHNLYPVNQNMANAVRSNLPLGEVVTVISSFKDGTLGLDSRGKKVYEPRDDHKGNAARAVFYMCAAYNGVSGNTWKLPNPISAFVNYSQEQEILKKWHWQDPVDGKEIARNDYIESLQNNRNPFIDSMNYVCYIDFTDMTKELVTMPCLTNTISIKENSNLINLLAYPNPADDKLNIAYQLKSKEKITYIITNSLGQTVLSESFTGLNSELKTIDISNLSVGVYNLIVSGNNFSKALKFVKK
ncbi:endonuclease [Flavobacteriales bacterium]|nr:endonuclease [Flavobacteriales bacterium]